ncbi:MAG: hypothetical protein ACSLEX_03965 [Minisyncoccota bacterium]
MNMNYPREKHWDADVARSHRGVSFFDNTIVRALLGVSIVLILGGFLVLGYMIRPSNGLLVLHYNVYFGVDIQGLWWQTFVLPVGNALLFGGHLLLSWYFYGRHERVASYLLLLGSNFLSIGTLIAIGSIIFINY